jgi:cardiolipin synthase
MLVDDDISVVGTANLDNRSFRLNFEIGVINHDRQFAKKMEDMLITDLQHCEQLLPREVAKWSLRRRLLSRCAYLFAPLQ